MQNVIWSNDTDRIDSIVDYWKEEAARLSEDMAKDPKGTIDDACWPVTDILDRAWRQAVSDYELPTAARLIEIIDDLDPYATGIAAHAARPEDPRRVRHARTGKHDEKTLKNQRKQLDNITPMRYNGGIGKTEGHARNPKEGI